MKPRQSPARRGSMVRMTTRAAAAAVTAALALGGLAFSASEAKAPATHCKTISTVTQTRAVTRPSPGIYSGPNDQTGTQSRTATTSRCQGKLVTSYTAWS